MVIKDKDYINLVCYLTNLVMTVSAFFEMANLLSA